MIKMILIKTTVLSLFLLAVFSPASAQDVPIVTFDELQQYLQPKDDKIYVINFWATWCKPCVEEMPYFEKLHQNYKDKNVQVVLVSVDFKSQHEKKVIPFVQKKDLKSRVILLDTQGSSDWIDKVDPSWSGAIPATVVIDGKTKTKQFFERQLTYAELEKAVTAVNK